MSLGPAAPTGDSAFASEVVDLLGRETSAAVPGWLAGRLAARFPGARRRTLRIYPAGASRIKGLPEYEVFSVGEFAAPDNPVPVSADPALAEAIASKRGYGLSAAGGEARFIALLSAGGEPRYAIELAGAVQAAARDEALRSLVAVSARYFERLADAETDPLTRLGNRRVFHTELDSGLRHWAGSGLDYGFALLDLDHFKRVNDEFGHVYGDEILVHFAGVLRRTFRATDRLYRYGGEEFAVVFAGASGPGAPGPIERLRAAVEAYAFPGVGRLTVSAGCTRIADSATPATLLVERADAALYWAKAHGRNRVASYEALVAEGALAPKSAPKADVTLF